MRSGNPRQLVEVDLPGHRLPANSRHLVIFEKEPATHGHPAGQLKRRVVKDKQVHSGREQDIEGTRRSAAEVSRDVYVRVGAMLTCDTAAVQVRETCSCLPEHGNSFRCDGFERLVHIPSLASGG